MNKDEWINNILTDQSFCIEETRKLSNDDYAQSDFLKQPMKECYFKQLISCIKKKHIACFLSEYSIYCLAEELTPEVFKALLKIKSSYRKSILIGLCHSEISFYQLFELVKLKLDVESLLQLINRIIYSDAFSIYDLEVKLKYGKKYRGFNEELQYILHETKINNIPKLKLSILEKYLT